MWPSWLLAAGAGLVGWFAPTPQALLRNVAYLAKVLGPAEVIEKGLKTMALLDLLPAAVKAYISSPEAADDYQLAMALVSGDVTAAEAALKKAFQDSGIPEPFKSTLDSDLVVNFLAQELIKEAQAMKSAL